VVSRMICLYFYEDLSRKNDLGFLIQGAELEF
jgi:hypothetical protein